MNVNSESSPFSSRRQVLNRTAFVTDRTLEFFTESELTTQMGYGRQLWPLIIVKELIDNGLDACEIGNITPEITITLEPDALTVSDNGPGIPAEVIEKSLDYHVRVSDKKHYVTPTRGQLGNALKCVWAAAYVADGTHSGLVEISGRGLHHRIEVNLDRIKQAPVIKHRTSDSVKTGTSVKVHWSRIASCEIYAPAIFYQPCSLEVALKLLVESYAAFNPQAAFHFDQLHVEPSNPTWKKWRTDQPPSAHWYRVADLRNLIAAHIASGDWPVRDFLVDFAGLSGTQVRQKVLAEAGIVAGTRLSELVIGNDIDLKKVEMLLQAMRLHSKPIKPDRLGIIGREHFEKTLAAANAENPKYWKQATFDEAGLPLVIEIGFGINRDERQRQRRLIGLNWSPVLKVPSGHIAEALNECQVQYGDAVTLAVHLAQPRFAFSDHGKGALVE